MSAKLNSAYKLSADRLNKIRNLYGHHPYVGDLLAHIAEVEREDAEGMTLQDWKEEHDKQAELQRENLRIAIKWQERAEAAEAELAKVRQELEAVIAVKDNYKYRGDAAEVALRSRDEAVRELAKAGRKCYLMMVSLRCCADLKEAPNKDECVLMGDAMRTWEAAAERLEKIVEQERKR